jgi:hypothetical protein
MTQPAKYVHVEDLLGLAIRTADGHLVGHIEEIRVHSARGEYVVDAFLLGAGALWRRLSVVRRLVPRGKTIVVRWDQLDLSEPSRPRLTCPAEALSDN